MKKIDMYKEVPEQFHNRLCDTLEQLEEEKIVRFPFKKYAVACAVALLATSTITVGAVEFFKWYQTARESLGTEQELEDKLTSQGAALPAEDADIQQNIEMKALQAVKTDDNFYLLAAFEWPEEYEWNSDIGFEDSQVISAQEFGGMTANFAEGPDETGTVFVEMKLLGQENVTYEGEVQVILTNLIQTEKTDYVEKLVEAEWKLTFHLPKDASTRTFLPARTLPVNGHELKIDRVEAGPFGVKLYTDEEQGRHAAYYSNIELAAVQYEDGSTVENFNALLPRSAAREEDGTFYFNLALQNAVDIDKVRGLVFQEDGEEFVLALGESAFAQALEESGNAGTKDASDHTENRANKEDRMNVTDLKLLYVRYDYAILTDNKSLYLWDAACESAEVIMNLADYSFDPENGGEIAIMPGGTVLAVHPAAASEKLYMVALDTFAVSETEAEGIWPVPGYEDYKNSFFKVAERSGLPEGVYSEEGYEAQGSAYVLYSLDGSVENMELVDITNN